MDNAETLNADAFAALVGWERDWQVALSNLLRSDAPISVAVRHALADAIEGSSVFGISMQLRGHERIARWMDSIATRRNRLALGRRVAEIYSRTGNVLAAFGEAAERLHSSEDFCRQSYYYAKNCDTWVEAARASSTICQRMTTEQVETEFHVAAVREGKDKPPPLDGPSFDLLMREWAAAAKHETESRGLGALAAEVMFNLARIEPLHR